jgi:hypothetical protein
MQKYGRLILAESQLCFNLCVTDVFYAKKRKNTQAQTSEDEYLIMAPIIVKATRVTKLLMGTMMTTARFRKMTTQIMKFWTTNVTVWKTKVEFPETKRTTSWSMIFGRCETSCKIVPFVNPEKSYPAEICR